MLRKTPPSWPSHSEVSYAKNLVLVGFFYFFEILKLHVFSFFLEFLRPERFRKLREACRNRFHLVAPPKTFMVTSYDQKTKKVIRR